MSNTELDELLKSIMAVTPRAGESYIRGSLRGYGVRIQRWRIRERLQAIDPVGRAASNTLDRNCSFVAHSSNIRKRWIWLTVFQLSAQSTDVIKDLSYDRIHNFLAYSISPLRFDRNTDTDN